MQLSHGNLNVFNVAAKMSFQDLPPEILIEILTSIRSFQDLLQTAMISRRFYDVFRENKISIVYSVLCNELGPVISEALTYHQVATPLDASTGATYHPQARAIISQYGGYLQSKEIPSPRN